MPCQRNLKRFVALIVVLGTLLVSGPVFAEPPSLTDLVVEPSVLTVGSGLQTVSVSMNVSDQDGDLNPTKVKLILKFTDGATKQKVVLEDVGDGRFSGQVDIDTTATQDISLKVKAKDFAKEKAVPLKTTVRVLPVEVLLTPGLLGPIPEERRPASSAILALSRDETRLYMVNTDPASVTVVDTASQSPLVELSVGREPRSIALDPRGGRAYVTNFGSSTLTVLDVERSRVIATVTTGRSPYGVVVSPDAQWLYVAEAGIDTITAYDTATLTPRTHFSVEDNPRGLAISADGRSLYVTHLLSGRLSVIDLDRADVMGVISTGIESNAAQFVAIHPSGEKAYMPLIRSRISNENLTFDTTIAPVVTVIDLNEDTVLRSEVLGLDAIDRPVNMPFAVDFSPDGRLVYVVNAGSNDISVVDLETGLGVAHIEVGDNPRGIVVTNDGSTAFVYNALSYDVSVVDLESNAVAGRIVVSASPLPPDVQRGKTLFFSSATPDLARDQWVSCASCHFEGLNDGRTWPFDDGPRNTTVMLGLANSAPYHWSGDRVDRFDFQKTVSAVQGGTGLSEEDNAALAAFLGFNEFPPSPSRNPDGSLTLAAELGRDIFVANGCVACHTGPAFTDGKLHDVGTGDGPLERRGAEFDTPSLLGLFDSPPYLHDGSASTLRKVLTTQNADDRHGNTSHLSDEERDNLIAYLLSLP